MLHLSLATGIELALTALLAVTLVYCIVLERRLAALRSGQDGLKGTISELNAAIARAGTAMTALKGSAADAAELLDARVGHARALSDELSLITASGERIAERIDRTAPRTPAARPAAPLPSGSVMNRLEALRAVR
jgi:hypothetical protein